MANFHRCFLPRLAHVVRPLTNSLATTKQEFTITKEMLKNTLKDLLANATLLVHPIRNAVLSITTDSSDCAIGGLLYQHHCGHLQSLAFFSRKLNDTEMNYTTFHRDILAVAAVVKHFQHSIEG